MIAVRVARDTDQRRASANVATVSLAAARTLIRSRSALTRPNATSESRPTIVTTTMSSGRVVPRRTSPFLWRRDHHTISLPPDRYHSTAATISRTPTLLD